MADIREIADAPAHWYRFPAGRWHRQGHTGHWWGRLVKHFEATEGGERAEKTSLTLSDGGVVEIILENERGVQLPTQHFGNVDVSGLCDEEIRHLGLEDPNAGRPKRSRAQAKKMDCDNAEARSKKIPRKSAGKSKPPIHKKSRDHDPADFPDVPAPIRRIKFKGKGAPQHAAESQPVQGGDADADEEMADPTPDVSSDGVAPDADSPQDVARDEMAPGHEPPEVQATKMACPDASSGAGPTGASDEAAAQEVPEAPAEAVRSAPPTSPGDPAPTTPPSKPSTPPNAPNDNAAGDAPAGTGDEPDGLALLKIAQAFLDTGDQPTEDTPAGIPLPRNICIAIDHNYGLFACRCGNGPYGGADRPYGDE